MSFFNLLKKMWESTIHVYKQWRKRIKKKDDPASLPLPNHTALNHLYALAIKNRVFDEIKYKHVLGEIDYQLNILIYGIEEFAETEHSDADDIDEVFTFFLQHIQDESMDGDDNNAPFFALLKERWSSTVQVCSQWRKRMKRKNALRENGVIDDINYEPTNDIDYQLNTLLHGIKRLNETDDADEQYEKYDNDDDVSATMDSNLCAVSRRVYMSMNNNTLSSLNNRNVICHRSAQTFVSDDEGAEDGSHADDRHTPGDDNGDSKVYFSDGSDFQLNESSTANYLCDTDEGIYERRHTSNHDIYQYLDLTSTAINTPLTKVTVQATDQEVEEQKFVELDKYQPDILGCVDQDSFTSNLSTAGDSGLQSLRSSSSNSSCVFMPFERPNFNYTTCSRRNEDVHKAVEKLLTSKKSLTEDEAMRRLRDIENEGDINEENYLSLYDEYESYHSCEQRSSPDNLSSSSGSTSYRLFNATRSPISSIKPNFKPIKPQRWDKYSQSREGSCDNQSAQRMMYNGRMRSKRRSESSSTVNESKLLTRGMYQPFQRPFFNLQENTECAESQLLQAVEHLLQRKKKLTEEESIRVLREIGNDEICLVRHVVCSRKGQGGSFECVREIAGEKLNYVEHGGMLKTEQPTLQPTTHAQARK